MNNYIVGLTGGIGSGKTTIANMFVALGVRLVDADIVAREVVSPGSVALSSIQQYFGKDYITPDGLLNRTKLRQRVFSSEIDKTWLNNLLHPLIRASILNSLNENTDQYTILVAPLLIENGLLEYVDRTLVIDVSEAVQIKRTVSRDNSDEKNVKSIISSQISRHDRLAKADDVIDNSNNDLNTVKEVVKQLHQTYLQLSCDKTQ